MDKISLENLKEKCGKFREMEGRASFYDIATEIAGNYPLQAAIIILATWNIGRFRFFLPDPKNLGDLIDTLEKDKPLFERIKDRKFQTVNFDEIGDVIKQIYSSLSSIKGVEYTGASKVMHLVNKHLFVMWDDEIRKGYKEKYGIPKGNSREDFLDFQKLMQKLFGKVKWDESNRTLPKAIDEYNYVTFTLPKIKKKMQNE